MPDPSGHPAACLSRRITLTALAAGTLITGGVLLGRFLSAPVSQSLRLPDGTQAFFRSDSKVLPAAGFPQPREIQVDGDVFFRTAAAPQPLILKSRLLVLTVTGATDLRLMAFSRQSGEQVEVLRGNVVARKRYSSPYSEPDVLTGGEMTLINRDIDLMEKEKADVPALRAWSEALMASLPRTKSQESRD